SLGDVDQHPFIFRIGQEPLTATLLRFRAVQILSTSFRALRERTIAAWNPIELEELWITCHEGAPASIKQGGLSLLKMRWWLVVLGIHAENVAEPGERRSTEPAFPYFLYKGLILCTE